MPAHAEMAVEQLLRELEALFGHRHRFGLAPGVADESLLMEPVHGIPVESLPGPGAGTILECGEMEEGEHMLRVKSSDGTEWSSEMSAAFYIEKTVQTTPPEGKDYTLPLVLGIIAVGLAGLTLWRKRTLS